MIKNGDMLVLDAMNNRNHHQPFWLQISEKLRKSNLIFEAEAAELAKQRPTSYHAW